MLAVTKREDAIDGPRRRGGRPPAGWSAGYGDISLGRDSAATKRLAAQVGENIARWRKLRGLSQAKLANLVGCDRSAICRWEAGQRLPTLPHLMAIGRVLRCGARPLLPADEGGRWDE